MEAAARGVVVRSLYNPVAHDCAPEQDHVAGLVTNGAEVRVTSARFPRMILIDGTHLLIDNNVSADSEPNGGWHITDRSTVRWAREVYLMLWSAATRWQDLGQPGEHMAT
ncbi:hypothetical protein ACFUNF_41985, partial [Streptomyces sp. NPDC057291]